jgi:pimeloyl-ACP methyl ester carboxylesterase
VLECSDVLLEMARRYGSPVGVIAHSFGAAATCLAVKRGLVTDALTFIAPLPSLDYGVEQFAARTQLPTSVMDRAVRLIEADLGLLRRDIELTTVGPELHKPLLCIHDQTDGVISVEASRRVVDVWPEARLLETKGLGHSRILRDPIVVKSAAAFLEQGLRERPIDLDRAFACA